MNIKFTALSRLSSDMLFRILFAVGLIWIVAAPGVLTSTFTFVIICVLTVFAGFTEDAVKTPLHWFLSLCLFTLAFCYRVDWSHIYEELHFIFEGSAGIVVGTMLFLAGYVIHDVTKAS